MCLLIAQPQGRKVKKDHLQSAYWQNPDGIGYAFIDRATNKIVTRKAMGFHQFWTDYQADWKRHGHSSPFLVHFRLATHGETNETNVHPFKVKTSEGETVFAHNGIIDIHIPKHEQHMSDTRMFGRQILNSLPDNWLDNAAIITLVEEFLGYGNKIAVLTTSPACERELYILNDDLGHYDKHGVWYSNHSYCYTKSKKKATATAGSLGRWDSDDDWAYADWQWRNDQMVKANEAERGDGNWDYALSQGDLELMEKFGYCVACGYRPCKCEDMCWECGGNLEDTGNPCVCCWQCGATNRDKCSCTQPLWANDYITEQGGFKRHDRYVPGKKGLMI